MPRLKKKILVPANSMAQLSSLISGRGLGQIDSREWSEQWKPQWVMYADLIAFASRAMRSEAVVLNNIVRFDRASQVVAAEWPHLRSHRFSDATFTIANTFHEVLSVAVALSHGCLAFNDEYLRRVQNPLFIHLIAPRITIAHGPVLLVPDGATAEAKFAGLEPRHILAGSAVVRAYALERQSAGGLITIDADGISELRKLTVRGDNGRVTNALRRWIQTLQKTPGVDPPGVFCRRRHLVDVPWLLMRPFQKDVGALWAADPKAADGAIETFLTVWESGIREFYSLAEDSVLETAKHHQAAVRHGVYSFQMAHGGPGPRYQTLDDVMTALKSGSRGPRLTKSRTRTALTQPRRSLK